MGAAGGGSRPGRIVLCADDYGMNGGASEAILALAERGRVSATSCMTNAPAWRDSAPALAPFAGRLGIGLHLVLSWGRPLGPMPALAPHGAFPPLGTLILLALLGRLAAGEIDEEIARQLDAFAEATGREPDFVDGHQHVHVLPGIRGALLRVLARRGGPGPRPWLRDSADRIPAILRRRVAAPKALLVHALAAGFRADAEAAGFATNRGFSGFRPFAPGRPAGPDIERALDTLGPRPLVMCHPGRPDLADPDDEIAPARAAEYAYLASDAFAEALSKRRLQLAAAPR